MLDDYESLPFRKYLGKAEVDKAVHTLEGILKGISIDGDVNISEAVELVKWFETYKKWVKLHPFNELIPIVANAIEDNVLSNEEMKDIIWFCHNISTENMYYDIITSDIQRLQGILHGILSDNHISDDEINGLRDWLEENEHLKQCYPYDEVYGLIISVLSDGKILDNERDLLKLFFYQFVNLHLSSNTSVQEVLSLKKEIKVSGICAVCPEISMQEKTYCFTGISSQTTRKGFASIVQVLGGTYNDRITQETNYLIIGDNGNPCWAFSCYGRKVEQAVQLRKKGHTIMIVHENDFWDTYQEYIDKQIVG